MACDDANPNQDVDDLYPEDSNPENRLGDASPVCSFGLSPARMTGFLRQFLLQVFCDADNITNKSLRQALQNQGVWQPGLDSGILIEDIMVWKPETIEQRPALLIKSGDWVWQQRVIGNQADENYLTGDVTYVGYWHGSHTIFAIGKEGLETQVLAFEVASLLQFYAPVIFETLNLHRLTAPKVGAPNVLKESKEHFFIPIDIAYIAQQRYMLSVDAPRLKRIVFHPDDSA